MTRLRRAQHGLPPSRPPLTKTVEVDHPSALEFLLRHFADDVLELNSSQTFARNSERGKAMLALAHQKNVPCHTQNQRMPVRGLIKLRQGVSLETLVSGRGLRQNVLLALDHIHDPHNLGALARSAEAFGVCGLVLPKHQGVPITAAVYASSAGAIHALPIHWASNLNEALRQLRKHHYWVVGADGATGYRLGDQPRFERTVLVLGSEGTGLHALTRSLCEIFIRIPMEGRVESLNASVAGAILLYDLCQKREAP